MFNFSISKTLKYIIGINAIAFLITMILYPLMGDTFADIFFLKYDIVKTLITPWSLITHSILHSSFMHLFMNMLSLFFIGMIFESIFNERMLASFYIACAIAGGLLVALLGTGSYLVGASGVIFGLLVASAVAKPNMELYLFFLFRVKLKWIAVFFVALQLIGLYSCAVGDSCSNVSYLGHLMGSLYGGVFAYFYTRGKNIQSYIDYLVFKYIYKSKFYKPKKEIVHYNMDDILDKINDKGMKSLTKEEKIFLKKGL